MHPMGLEGMDLRDMYKPLLPSEQKGEGTKGRNIGEGAGEMRV